MTEASQTHLRNIAIVAHVDHGKTSLVDAMLRYSRVFRPDQEMTDLIMDSDPQERERGITILAKNTGIKYGDVMVNIIDTPGHADFSGEVERVVNMADGCLLVVDAVEGPMPQTRYVLRIALQQGLRPILVINKVDRASADASAALSAVQDLFLELVTDPDQLDFPVLYTSARNQYALSEEGDAPTDMAPLFDAIVNRVPAPVADPDAPLQLLVAALDYDNYLGQIAVGRVSRGRITKGEQVVLIGHDNSTPAYRVERLFTFRDLARHEIESASAGEIVALSGLRDVRIGDTVASPDAPGRLGAHEGRRTHRAHDLRRQHVAVLRPGGPVRYVPHALGPAPARDTDERGAPRRAHRQRGRVSRQRARRAPPLRPDREDAPRGHRVSGVAP